MAAYDLEEQEQLAELKAWWKQNGNLVTGVVVAAASASWPGRDGTGISAIRPHRRRRSTHGFSGPRWRDTQKIGGSRRTRRPVRWRPAPLGADGREDAVELGDTKRRAS